MMALLCVPLVGRVAAPAPDLRDEDDAPPAMQVSLLGDAAGANWLPGLGRSESTTRAAPSGPRRSIVRTVKLAQGTHYDVSLQLAGLAGAKSPPSVLVQAGNIRRHLVGTPGTDWSRVGFRFQAPRTGMAELHIVAASDTVVLDDVELSAVSETGSLPLLVAGLFWMGLVLNRRRPLPIIPRLGPN